MTESLLHVSIRGLTSRGGALNMRVGAVSLRTATSRTQRVQIAQKIAAPKAAPSASIVAPVMLLDSHRTQFDVSQLKGKGDVVDVTV